VRDLELAPRADGARVHHALGYALAVEVRERLDELGVLEEEEALDGRGRVGEALGGGGVGEGAAWREGLGCGEREVAEEAASYLRPRCMLARWWCRWWNPSCQSCSSKSASKGLRDENG
jgi:hypothetical protein